MASFPRFFNPPRGSYFLFGPRGTGKSTWLAGRHSDAPWIDLLDPATQREYLARPERLRDLVRAAGGRGPVVIDEIQRVPQLLPVVHQMIERDPALRFVLTGSSARKLRQGGVDLLGGRAVRTSMHPFMAAEMGVSFDLEESLKRGMVPLIRTAEDADRTQRGYIDLYVQQEVKAEGLVRRLDDFSRFLEAISFSHARVLNVAAVARDCSASRNTVESYVTIMEDLLLASRLPIFSRRAKRATVAHSKFYLFDCGVYRSLRPAGPIDPHEEIVGPALEGLVLQHLRAWIDYRGSDLRLHFWRTQGGSEVDFVLYGADGFFAIEVKNSSSIRPQDLRGLRAFREDYPESSTVLLYRGRETLERSGVIAMPVEVFLRELHPGAPLPEHSRPR